MNWRLALSFLIPWALAGCLGVKQKDGEGEEGTDGSIRDSGREAPDGDIVIPEGCIEVSRVIDGDTFVYVNTRGEEIRVRLLGIDTQERGEACYEAGRNALSSLIRGRIIRIVGDDNADNVDIYSRELRYVSLCGSMDVGEINLQMVRGGWACVFDSFVDGLMLEAALRAAESAAAGAQAGCWEDNVRFCSE